MIFAGAIDVEFDRQRSILGLQLFAAPQTLSITVTGDHETRIRMLRCQLADRFQHQRPVAMDLVVTGTGQDCNDLFSILDDLMKTLQLLFIQGRTLDRVEKRMPHIGGRNAVLLKVLMLHRQH